MIEQEESAKEACRKDRRRAEEAKILAKDQARKKNDLSREQAIQEAQKAEEVKREEQRAPDETKQLAKEQAIRQAFLAKRRS